MHMTETKQKTKFQKIWADPVWSKVISAFIIFLFSVIYSFLTALISGKTFINSLLDFWTLKVDLWILISIVLGIIFCFYLFKEKIKNNPLLRTTPFRKYFGIYEIYHYAPHTTGNPKLTKSYLYFGTDKIQYVHKLFECEEGEIEQIDGHLFLNLKNKEQKNAPYYFIIKCINDAKIEYLGGVCLGIGQNQNCHPIAVKLAIKKRNDLNSFTIESFKGLCSIEDLPKDKIKHEPYAEIVKFLWNNCEDKDILF